VHFDSVRFGPAGCHDNRPSVAEITDSARESAGLAGFYQPPAFVKRGNSGKVRYVERRGRPARRTDFPCFVWSVMRGKLRDSNRETAAAPPRPQEQLLIDHIPHLHPRRAFCTSAGRGQFARALAQARPRASVTCLFLDLYQLRQTERELSEPVPNLQFLCQADFPDVEVDLAAVTCSAQGIAELTRDLLQQAHERLALRGRLVAAIDNAEDQWLHQELKKLFSKVTREPKDEGVFYAAVKTSPLAKRKNFDAEFAFRDRGRLIYVHSRPGVFSHRRLDVGARALINSMEIHPQMRVLDLGCGSGAVALAAALSQPDADVWAVDSNPRAVECAERGAVRNGVANLTTRLDADGSALPERYFDLVLANPPYYSHYRLADVFLRTSIRSLNDAGELLLVTKAPAWFREHLPERFRDVRERPHKDYFVFSCRKPNPRRAE
jgi:16S rRNA (guanine1207-N2)-methyltransferase